MSLKIKIAKNILKKILAITTIIFTIYLLILYGYDFYYYKKAYIFFCSKIYCLSYIEFKDFATILSTLIGTIFVIYGLFTWSHNFRLNLMKEDLLRFRSIIHELLQSIDLKYSLLIDQYHYIIESQNNANITSFNQTLANYAKAIDDLKELRDSETSIFNKLRFEKKYFILHGGNFNFQDFEDNFFKYMIKYDELQNYFVNDNVNSFLHSFTTYSNLHVKTYNELSNLLELVYVKLHE